MGDLISRKAVLDIIQGELNLNCGYDANIALFSVKKCVSELPTAYDMDAVVEQLEEESDYEPIDYDYCDVACTDEQHFIATDKAIEIVRKGGAE